MLQRLFLWLLPGLLAACTGLPLNAKAPTFSVTAVDIRRFGLAEQRFDFSLRVNNPNSFDLNLTDLEFDLEVNGKPFAKGYSHDFTMIPASSNSTMHVEAVTESKDLLRQLKGFPPELLKGGVPYEIRGRAKTNGIGWLPFHHKGFYGQHEIKSTIDSTI
jgi:hypothetical protein